MFWHELSKVDRDEILFVYDRIFRSLLGTWGIPWVKNMMWNKDSGDNWHWNIP